MSENPVVFEKVSKRFGKVNALSGVDLSVEKGEIYCLLGVNGAGKSTALRLLLNLQPPSEGSVIVFGKQAPALGREEFGRIGFISESQKLYDWMTLGRLLAVVEHWYPSWDHAYCRNLIELFRLPLDRKIKTLSRGMRMKVKMLLAFSFQPELVVMDEPFSGLDPIVRQECIEGLIDWAQERERTLVISSHDIDDVEPICDRVGILHQGSMILDENLEQLKARMKRVNLYSDAEVDNGGLPVEWIESSRKQRSYQFVDTDFNPRSSEMKVREFFKNPNDLRFSAMSLKELFVTCVRNRESGKR